VGGGGGGGGFLVGWGRGGVSVCGGGWDRERVGKEPDPSFPAGEGEKAG